MLCGPSGNHLGPCTPALGFSQRVLGRALWTAGGQVGGKETVSPPARSHPQVARGLLRPPGTPGREIPAQRPQLADCVTSVFAQIPSTKILPQRGPQNKTEVPSQVCL